MTLIKSISGIRGTIGGSAGDNLTPIDIVKFTAAYARLRTEAIPDNRKLVVGRDARVSGPMVEKLVTATLTGMGFDVVNIGMATTPTTELAVGMERAAGGIIITASHNPMQWNALKLLNERGEFLNKEEGERVLTLADDPALTFAGVERLGTETSADYTQRHIDAVLALPLVDRKAIAGAGFRVAIDCVNSVGGIILPRLLQQLGVTWVTGLYTEPDGRFRHNPEPLEKNLGDIMELMKQGGNDIAFVVDPDVDRLALIAEDGRMYGEEYTLVTAADYVLSRTPGNTVSNLSSTRALRDVTEAHGGQYEAAAVGEVNVVAKMKETRAVIGGEGNGGVIYPECHYGRDALVGIALILSHLARKKCKTSELRASYPAYYMSKQKIELTPGVDTDGLLRRMAEHFAGERLTTIDGVKIDFAESWAHLRKSNTEPIIRVYTEAKTQPEADALGERMIGIMRSLL